MGRLGAEAFGWMGDCFRKCVFVLSCGTFPPDSECSASINACACLEREIETSREKAPAKHLVELYIQSFVSWIPAQCLNHSTVFLPGFFCLPAKCFIWIITSECWYLQVEVNNCALCVNVYCYSEFPLECIYLSTIKYFACLEACSLSSPLSPFCHFKKSFRQLTFKCWTWPSNAPLFPHLPQNKMTFKQGSWRT